MKKQQLLEENIQLRRSVELNDKRDETRRREFAKAFDWRNTKAPYGGYSTDSNPSLPSWEEVFVQVGKLLTKTGIYELEKRIEGLDSTLMRISREIKQKPEPDFIN